MKLYAEETANKIKNKLRKGASVQDVKSKALAAGIPMMTVYSWAKKIAIEGTEQVVEKKQVRQLVTTLEQDLEKLNNVYNQISSRVPSIVLQGMHYSELSLGLANMILLNIAGEAKQKGDTNQSLKYVGEQGKQLLLAEKLASSGARVIRTVHPELESEYVDKMLEAMAQKQLESPRADFDSFISDAI